MGIYIQIPTKIENISRDKSVANTMNKYHKIIMYQCAIIRRLIGKTQWIYFIVTVQKSYLR